MAAVSRVANGVSSDGYKQHKQGGWKIGRLVESIGKYVVDSAVNVSTKGSKGRMQLHKAVQEELQDKVLGKQCDDKGKLDNLALKEDIQAKIEKIQEEMNVVKHKNVASSEKLEPVSSDKFPPVQLKEKGLLMPNKKRIMIRSRL